MSKQIVSKSTAISRLEVETAYFDIEQEILDNDRNTILAEIRGKKIISGVSYWGSHSDIQKQITYWYTSVVVDN